MAEFESTGGQSGATCAVHPVRSAQSICARCGNFMCTECTDNGTHEACPSCRALTGDLPGFHWNRETFTLDGLMGFSWEHFKREWVMLSLAALVFFVVLFGFGFVGNILQVVGNAIHEAVGAGFAVIGQFLQSIVQATLTGGFVVLVYGVMRGESADIGKLFSQFSKLGTYAVVTLIYFGLVLIPVGALAAVVGVIWYAAGEEVGLVAAIVAGLLAIVPLIWLAMPFVLTNMEIALGGETSGSQVVKNAFALANGKRLWMFLFSLVVGLIATGGALACCVGILPAIGLGQILTTALYLALRNGSGLPPLRPQV